MCLCSHCTRNKKQALILFLCFFSILLKVFSLKCKKLLYFEHCLFKMHEHELKNLIQYDSVIYHSFVRMQTRHHISNYSILLSLSAVISNFFPPLASKPHKGYMVRYFNYIQSSGTLLLRTSEMVQFGSGSGVNLEVCVFITLTVYITRVTYVVLFGICLECITCSFRIMYSYLVASLLFTISVFCFQLQCPDQSRF